MLNKQVSKVKSNAVGFLAGAALTYWAMKKYTSQKTMVTVLVALVGGVAGANAQSMISAKTGSVASAAQTKK